MLSVFFLLCFSVSGSVSFVVFYRSSFLRGRCLKKFSGANFCFWVSVLVGFFWCCFAYAFALLFVFSLPKLSWKNSIDVRSGVFGVFFSPPLVFFRRRRRPFVCLFPFFFQEKKLR